MFFWRGQRGLVELAFTDRSGGVSEAPFDGLNLGGHVGDAPGAVHANRQRLADALGVPFTSLVLMDQRHGADVQWVHSRPDVAPSVDAIATQAEDVALVVLVADCTPVLLWDEQAGVIAAVHAGRPGMTGGIVEATVKALREKGSENLRAVVGPSVCGRCYEVPLDMREAAAEVSPESRTVSWTGTPAIDVAAGVVAQLQAHNVATEWIPGCAREDERLFSHRRSGVTGRFGGVIIRRSRRPKVGQ